MMSADIHARLVDGVAAAIFAAAVSFPASALGSGALAAGLAPIAFALVYIGLRRIDTSHRLPHFELQPIDRAGPDDEALDDGKVVRLFDSSELATTRPAASASAGRDDASAALTLALAELKRSLR
jgi:hypothetical protein